jgi:hypothetical protein
MVQLSELKEEESREIIAKFILNDPGFTRLLEHLRESLPEEILTQAATFQDWLLEKVVIELQATIEGLDIKGLAKAVLSNDSLKGKVALHINDLGFGLNAQIKQAITDQIHSEIALIQNLLSARRAKERADLLAVVKERDKLKQQREIARAKGQLVWYRLSALKILIPTLLFVLSLGFFGGLNYPGKIGCQRDDPICNVRVRPVIWY